MINENGQIIIYDCQPYLLPHWQVTRATLQPKLTKEVTNASPRMLLRPVWDFPTHKKQNKFVLRIKVSAD